MTPLETAIHHAIARTRVQEQQPAAVLAAIADAGYVVIDTSKWRKIVLARDSDGTTFAAWRELIPGDLGPSAEGSERR